MLMPMVMQPGDPELRRVSSSRSKFIVYQDTVKAGEGVQSQSCFSVLFCIFIERGVMEGGKDRQTDRHEDGHVWRTEYNFWESVLLLQLGIELRSLALAASAAAH